MVHGKVRTSILVERIQFYSDPSSSLACGPYIASTSPSSLSLDCPLPIRRSALRCSASPGSAAGFALSPEADEQSDRTPSRHPRGRSAG